MKGHNREVFVIIITLIFGIIGFTFTTVQASEKTETKAVYVGDNEKTCKVCHAEQVKTFTTLKKAKAFSLLKEDEKKNASCVKCHVTGYGEEGGFVSLENTPKLINVQCEACHGPASLHLKVSITDKEKRKATVKMPKKADCEKCHNKESPDFKGFDYEKYLAQIKHWKDKGEKS